jgi:nucleoside-diphosphate-sugar epimerase
LADAAAVSEAARGCDAVFHVAAKAGVWGPYEAYHRANVVGTRHVLEACRAHGVSRLVYTSTPSVVHGGGDVEGLDESAPYATHFETHYPATKAEAERMVLAAHGPDLMTVALRPHLIWGPGDNHLVPRIVARARAGRLRLIGGPPKKVDATYIDNAAWAHVLALDKLAPGAACGGRAYFIAQGEPLPMNELVNRILGAVGLPPVTKTVPPRVAWLAGAAMEGAWRLLGRQDEPLMTRFVARQLSTAHWYDLSAAKRDLGYEAQVPLAEGLARLGAWWKAHPDGV